MPAETRVIAAALLFMTALIGCAPAGGNTATPQKPVLAVSIFPVASLVQQLSGDWAEVVTLLPPGASPHSAGMSADQVRAVSRAKLLVVVGMDLDSWAEKAAAASGSSPPTVRFADLVGAPPPNNNHLWLDPVLAKQCAAALAVKLEEQFPEHAPATKKSAEILLADLTRLDGEYREQLAAVPRKELITFHNAFDLIAERYGLKILVRLTDIELAPGGEVTPDKFREAIDAVHKYGVKTLYCEPEFPDQAVQALKRETGADVLTLDPEGSPALGGFHTYQEMMRANLRTLVNGQAPHPSPLP
jgi:ABC-type Zn uptake system ZnuABC Zn-binding protein ZnuA